ncbi:COesterase domain-containing protein [Mycena chlorophos]|uniref:COesterase domain-containing protein n=1 Tax=Mycena chlorophos TaxID=658473 RepID=A0A8H6S7M1_MYCCL|nr:COesterase domain-containing protein [Mycena chlorophos]
MKARAISFFALLARLLPVEASGPIVDLGAAGQWEGFIDAEHNVSTFLGIRFAAPPTDDLRWQPPAAPSPVQGIQQATSQPPMCYQGEPGMNATGTTVLTRRDAVAESEDCLFLNVHSPSLTPKKLLPTLVWIYGGGKWPRVAVLVGIPRKRLTNQAGFYSGAHLMCT